MNDNWENVDTGIASLHFNTQLHTQKHCIEAKNVHILKLYQENYCCSTLHTLIPQFLIDNDMRCRHDHIPYFFQGHAATVTYFYRYWDCLATTCLKMQTKKI